MKDASLDEEDIPNPPRIQFLPESIADLRTRVWGLILEFLNGELGNRNEIDSILDELKKRVNISDTDCQKVIFFLEHGSGLTDNEIE